MNEKIIFFQKPGLRKTAVSPFSLQAVVIIHLVAGFLKLIYQMSGIQELDSEEAQYWVWSRQLDFWYYSKPPLIAYLNRISTTLFGVSEWSVRMNALILSIGTAVGIYYLTLELYNSRKHAFYAAVLLLFFPAFVYISMFFTTDSPLSFFWVLSLLFFYKAVRHSDSLKNWILTAVFVGLGLLSKYALLFFYPVSFFYLLFYHREKLKKKGYYIFLTGSLIFFIPFFIWNSNYNWIGLKHLTHLAGFTESKKSFDFLHVISRQLEFWGGQILLNLPVLFLVIFRKRFNRFQIISKETDRFLIFQAGFVFFVFFILSFFKRIHINWLLFSYIPVYILVIRIFIENPVFRGLKIGFVTIFLLTSLFFFQPVFAAGDFRISKLLPGKRDPNNKLTGWTRLARTADETMKFSEKKPVLIYTDSRSVAAELTFYMEGNPSVFCLPVPERKINQWDIWGLPNNEGSAVLFVLKNPAAYYNWEIDSGNLIHRTRLTHSYKNHVAGTYHLYLCKEFPEINP